MKAAVVYNATPADYAACFTHSAGERVIADLAGKYGHKDGMLIDTKDVHQQYVNLGQHVLLQYIQNMIEEGLL